MERRRLGRTGHESTIAILGGAAFATCTPAQAEEGFADAMARGVNHLDIAPSYGAAERNLGPLVPAVRDRLFVACKTHRRSADGAAGPARGVARAARRRPLRPLPAPRRHEPGGARRAGWRGRGHPRGARRGPDPLRRRDRSRPRRSRRPPRGAPALRPRHRDVPRVPRGVGRPGVPGRRRGPAGRVRRPRRRCHGHQGRRPPSLGRPGTVRRQLVRAMGRTRTPSPAASASPCRRRACTPSAPPATSRCCGWRSMLRRRSRPSTPTSGTPRWPRRPPTR